MKTKKQVEDGSVRHDLLAGPAFAVAEHEADFVRAGENSGAVLPDSPAAGGGEKSGDVLPDSPAAGVVDPELPPLRVVDPSVDDDRLFALYVGVLSSMDHLRDMRKEQTRYRHALKMAREALDFYNNNQMEG